jgi:hypothetical protein
VDDATVGGAPGKNGFNPGVWAASLQCGLVMDSGDERFRRLPLEMEK